MLLPVEITIITPTAIVDISEKLKKFINNSNIGGIEELKLDVDQGKPEMPIRIDRDLIDSKAFNSISAACYRVYFRFLTKRKFGKVGRQGKEQWAQTNNGELVFTYAEAEKVLGLPRSTFMKCIDRLIAVGLIDITHSGSGGKKGDVSLYAISERWRKYGTPDFVVLERPKDKRSGRGFAFHPEHRFDRNAN